jgi:ornithine decarboxylase
MTDRILEFLRTRRPEGPCVVVDLQEVRANYLAFERALPDSRVFYAVKANPAPEILSALAALGSCFDCASVVEIQSVLAAGATADRISFGNTIKKERDIATAHRLGVTLFAVDCVEEVAKISRAAPGSRVFCRILCDGAGADWPLSRKFGCTPGHAPEVLEAAHRAGLTAAGISFHVGSQQRNTEAWDAAIASASAIFRTMAERGIRLTLVNLGGGFPARYRGDEPAAARYGLSIRESILRHFGTRVPETIIEPGRGMGGTAGILKTEVVLNSKKDPAEDTRWVYLDIGKFGGLAETRDEAIRYPIRSPRDGGEAGPCVLAGPTCDSADVLYEKTPYVLPLSLEIGDELLIEGTGAYTTTYASVGFNGFAPLKSFVI